MKRPFEPLYKVRPNVFLFFSVAGATFSQLGIQTQNEMVKGLDHRILFLFGEALQILEKR